MKAMERRKIHGPGAATAIEPFLFPHREPLQTVVNAALLSDQVLIF